MSKFRIFKFLKDENKEIEEITAGSFKKAVKSFQNKVKQKMVYIEWLSKKGQEMTKWQKLPLGREKKIER